MAFFGGEVAAPEPDKVPPGKELVVTAGQECIIIIVKSAGASMAFTAVEELLLTKELSSTASHQELTLIVAPSSSSRALMRFPVGNISGGSNLSPPRRRLCL